MALITCIIISIKYNTTFPEFLDLIEFDALFFIIGMQMIVTIVQRYKIFQWIVLKSLHLTKGDHIRFFFLICFLASFSSALVSDITIGIIFVPLVIRACRILEINPAPYLFGLSFTINIGSIWTPVSSSENILISAAFGLDFKYFISYLTPIVLAILVFTTILLNNVMLKKQRPPTERQKKILLEILQPSIVIENQKKFKLNLIGFIIIIICFIFIKEIYLVAILGAIILNLANKIAFNETLKDIDWKIVSFLIGIFLLMGCMEINGTFTYIGNMMKNILVGNDLLAAIIILFLISIFSGFLAQIPTALVFINITKAVYISAVPNLVIIAIILGINIGSNFLPQGAACDIITLNLAEKYDVSDFNYKTLLKNGSIMTCIHLLNSLIYLFILSFFI